ncbi:FecR family protein [Leptospira inadai]|nr:FecR domain-containing protein [Leptospira inadai]PNV75894.1 iron dicitrate transport regulator FecR [Leptospira inadai serovar Lyme]
MNGMTPEFEPYAEFLKRTRAVSKLPDFDPSWIGKSPRFEVEAVVVETSNKSNIVELPKSSRRVFWIAAAAVLLVGIGIGGYFKFSKSQAPVVEGAILKAAVVFVKGDAKVVRDVEAPIHLGDILTEGDRIVTGSGGSVDIGLTDSSIIRLKEKSTLLLKGMRETEASQVKLSLLSGRILSLVEKEKKNANFVVDTPTVVAAVRGTSFEVDANSEESSVYVADGAVEVTPLVNDEAQKVLNVGGLVVVTVQKATYYEDTDRSKKVLPEYTEMRKNLNALDKEVMETTRNLKSAKTEAELSQMYDKNIEQIILKDGRELRGVVVSQKKGKLIIQTLKGSYILDEAVVETIRY